VNNESTKYESRGGRRQGSGRKKDGRQQITIRIKKEIVEALKPGVPAKIRALVESKYKALAIMLLTFFCLACAAVAEDADITIRMYLLDSGYSHISDTDISTVRAYMKANGYEHVQGIDLPTALAGQKVTASRAADETMPTQYSPRPTSTTPSSVAALSGLGLLLIVGFGGLLFYFLPTICAQGKRNQGAIFVLNLFLGWSFIGWVVALVWACTKEPMANPGAAPTR
jgi:Superinfection immunity protein